MNTMKIFIENWPKAKPFLLEWAPIIIAVIAVVISWISLCWTRRDFVASHRPYVWAVTHAFLNGNNTVIVDVNTLRKLCLNAPAEIIGQEYSYIAVEENNNKKVIHTENVEKKFIMYPADPKVSQETYGMNFNLVSEIAKINPEKLIRKVRIDYKEVSSKRKYFFEAEWEFDKESNAWKPLTSMGN